jgi:hypothetical protein
LLVSLTGENTNGVTVVIVTEVSDLLLDCSALKRVKAVLILGMGAIFAYLLLGCTALSVATQTAAAAPSGSSSPSSISLSPASVTLNPSQTLQFTPTVTGASNETVTWSVSPAIGDISPTGTYTAPASITSGAAVTVTATSVANPTMVASAEVAFATPVAQASKIYYVDNVGGRDTNNGMSPSSAFATISKVNSLKLTGGQTVEFLAGDEWHEQLNVAQSGTSGSPITYTSYGNGPQPIISAADTVSGWTRGGGTAAQETCSSPAFCSGFEASAMSDWTTSTNNGDTSVAISTAQAHHGASSMALKSTSGTDTRGGVTKTIPSVGDNNTLAIRWYFLAPAGSMKPNSSIRTLCLMSGGNQIGFSTLTTDGNGNPSTIDFYDTANSIRVLNATPLSGYLAGAWNEIEIDFAVSSTSGGGTLYLNGKQLSQINNADTHTESSINSVTLGNIAYGGAIAAGGTVYFDDFKTSNTAKIGPFSAGIPTTVWYHTQTADPRLINFGGQAGSPVASVDEVELSNQFYWDGSSKLYVYSTVDPSSVIEVPQRSYALASPGASYVTVSGLQLRGAQQYDLFCTYSCSNWTVTNNTLNDSYSTALFFEVDGYTSVAGISITNNKVTGTGAGGIQVNNGIGLVNIVGNEVSDFAKIYNPIYGTQNAYADGIEMYSQDGQQGFAYVAYNYIHDGGAGSSVSYGGGIHADSVAGMDIEHNTIENVNASGVQLEKSSGSIARYNLVVNAGTFQYDSGLFIRAGEGMSVSNQVAEYNTISGGWWACNLGITQDGGVVTATNITIEKNICVGATSGTQFYADKGANGSGNAILGNSFGVQGTNFIVFAGSPLDTYSAFDQAAGYSTESVEGNPQFVDPLGGNYNLLSVSPVTGIGAFP